MSFTSLLIFLLSGVGITVILTVSSLFEGIREAAASKEMLGEILSCPMCMGFWIGGLAGLLLYSPCATLNPDANLIVIFLGDAFLVSIMAWIYYLGLANIQFKH